MTNDSYVLAKQLHHMMAVGRSGSALVLINEVNLRRVRLVLGVVNVSVFNSRCGTFISTTHPGQLIVFVFIHSFIQLSLASPSWVAQ